MPQESAGLHPDLLFHMWNYPFSRQGMLSERSHRSNPRGYNRPDRVLFGTGRNAVYRRQQLGICTVPEWSNRYWG